MTRARIYKVAGRLIDVCHAATGGNFVPSSGQTMCSPLLPLPALRKTLSGVERTWRSHRKMFAFEPYATLAVHCGNGFDAGFSSIKVSVCAAKMPSPELGGWTMNFGEAIKSGFDNYVTFSGRAARSEFWYWILFSALANLVGGIIDGALGTGLIGVVISLALLLPGVAVSVRRLHDLDRTGWWLLIAFTGIGIILLIVWNCMKGTTGSNSFGADPLAA